MLSFILDVSHGHFTSNRVCARRSQGELRVYVAPSHSLMRDILWHEELFDLLCMYSHVVTVANVVH